MASVKCRTGSGTTQSASFPTLQALFSLYQHQHQQHQPSPSAAIASFLNTPSALIVFSIIHPQLGYPAAVGIHRFARAKCRISAAIWQALAVEDSSPLCGLHYVIPFFGSSQETV